MLYTECLLYEDINRILDDGFVDENPRPHYSDGTPAHTISVNHVIRSYNLQNDFPITLARKIAWKTAIKEIFCIFQKPTNKIEDMENMGIGYWRDWDIGDGTIGQRYGATVSRYDLLKKLIDDIKTNPYGRRHIMDLWQETDLRETAGLAPCAFLTIWNVRKTNDKEYLDMVLIQRSGDMLTASGAGGINEVQYAALLMMIARHLNYLPGKFTHFIANEQIYDRHIENAKEMLNRLEVTKNIKYEDRPILKLKDSATDFFSMTIDDFELINYNPITPQLKFDLGI